MSTIKMIINNFTLLFFSITVLATIVMYLGANFTITQSYFTAFILINIVARSLLSGISNLIPTTAQKIAEQYHWPLNCSLQRDVASADIAFAVMGIISFFSSVTFRFATILGFSICWIITESIGVIKVSKNYLFPPDNYLPIDRELFIGMVIDLFWVLSTLTLFVLYLKNG